MGEILNPLSCLPVEILILTLVLFSSFGLDQQLSASDFGIAPRSPACRASSMSTAPLESSLSPFFWQSATILLSSA